MKIVNVSTGKIGNYLVGPKFYLNESIRLGEVAICIGKDLKATKPMLWLIGGCEQLIDYISLARTEGELEDDDATLILTKLDEAKKLIPINPTDRLASVLSIESNELKDLLEMAQVAISAPISGVQEFSNAVPKLLNKQTFNSIH